MPKISIIVPVYKVEQYIHKCLESVMQQTYENWECLLIDDGSPDNCGLICDKYAQADARFKVFHVKNGGVSRARNYGLNYSTGEYILFLDSDDSLSKDCLEKCVKSSIDHKLDIVQFGLAWVSNNGNAIYKSRGTTDVLNGTHFIQNGIYNLCAGGSMIKHEIVMSNGILFNPDLKLAEDQIFIASCIRNSSRIIFIDNPLYLYFQNSASAVHNQRNYDMEKSCFALAKLGKEWSPIKRHCDITILNFCIDMIGNDVSYDTIRNIIIYSSPCAYQEKYHLEILFYYLSKLSIRLAYRIVYYRTH